MKNVQLSRLNNKQLDELAALVNERGVVFFRDQDLTTERQVEIFEHFGVLDKHTTQKVYSPKTSKSENDQPLILAYSILGPEAFHRQRKQCRLASRAQVHTMAHDGIPRRHQFRGQP